MESDKETVAEIVKEMRGTYYKMGRSNARLDHDMMGYMSFIANRIESAHKREVEELSTAIRRLAEDACGHCDARYCQNDGEQEHMPCRVVYEAQALVRKYSPPENETTQESDDGMPF